MKDYISYCGLDCEICEVRLAAVRNDNELREKVAKEWSELNSAEITPEMISCTGCRFGGVKTPYCDSVCPIRKCAVEKKAEACGSCSGKYDCDKLKALLKNNTEAFKNLTGYRLITLRECPELMDRAAEWFYNKWGVPKEAYLKCMADYLGRKTEYGWYLCLDGEQIIGGMGVIANDFHDLKDLAPNVCAAYTEKAYRGQGIAGHLLNMTVEDMRSKGISPLYLAADHTGFYERYGWVFLGMIQGDGRREKTRMYVHW